MSERPFLKIRPTQSQLIEKFTGGERNLPTPFELVALDPHVNPEVLATVRDEHPEEFDVDVVGIMNHVYPDVERRIQLKARELLKGKVTEPVIFIGASIASLLYGAVGTISAVRGDGISALYNYAIASIYGLWAKSINNRSHGRNLEATTRVIKRHFPPIYSGRALEEAMEIAYKGGLREGTQRGFESGLHLAQTLKALSERARSREPLYVSLDKKTTINDPYELLFQLGRGSLDMVDRLFKILNKSGQSALSLEDIEFVRMSLAAIDKFSLPPNIFSDDERTSISALRELRSLVALYEESIAGKGKKRFDA